MTNRLKTTPSTAAIRPWRLPAIVILVASTALTVLTAAPPAEAAAKQAPPAPPTQETAPREAGEPIMAIVSIKSQHVTIYDADGWILRAPVSTGTTGRETPAGIFSVVEKDKDHHSNLYDDASMPNMQRITWSGIALHGGPLPGHPASHGCVRMPYGFAERLVRQDADRHARDHRAERRGAGRVFRSGAVRAEGGGHRGRAGARRKTRRRGGGGRRDGRRGEEGCRRSGARGGTARGVAAQAGMAQDPRRCRARVRRQGARRRQGEPSQGAGRGPKQKAAAKAAELATQLDTAKADAKSKLDAVAATQNAAKAAEAKRADTANAARDAKLALEPVSIFISRKTQRLYVRRGFAATLEVPITIRNPDKPIGTHVFTAMARTDGGLRWTAVTIDSGDDAKAALERISIPQDVLDRIAPTALPRSSIIISDEPLNRETNYRTEFVVVLNNQPQGGLAMRPPATDLHREDGGFFSSFLHWGNSDSQYASTRQRGGQSYYQRSW